MEIIYGIGAGIVIGLGWLILEKTEPPWTGIGVILMALGFMWFINFFSGIPFIYSFVLSFLPVGIILLIRSSDIKKRGR